MPRRDTSFVCQSCGAAYGRWQGKCDACGEWNAIAEESSAAARPQMPGRAARGGRLFALEALTGAAEEAPRLASGLAELDRVTGGGFVRGSVLLLGGDPGIGKSTLLIQVAAALARARHRAVYISGEEAVAQVRLRAERLGLIGGQGLGAQVELAAETSVEDIVATAIKMCKIWQLAEVIDGEVIATEGARLEGIVEARWFTRAELERETVYPWIIKAHDWADWRKSGFTAIVSPSRSASF